MLLILKLTRLGVQNSQVFRFRATPLSNNLNVGEFARLRSYPQRVRFACAAIRRRVVRPQRLSFTYDKGGQAEQNASRHVHRWRVPREWQTLRRGFVPNRCGGPVSRPQLQWSAPTIGEPFEPGSKDLCGEQGVGDCPERFGRGGVARRRGDRHGF